jgi:N-acetylmuramoyl-L-alanine amidase
MKIVQGNFKFKNSLIPLNPDNVKYIILHHADAKKATPEAVHSWHLSNGWAGIGYNEYITKDGTVYIARGDNIGAHSANNNSKSYGICLEGDYDTEAEVPQVQFDALVERLKYHKSRFKNLVGIEPHSKFNATSCPGKYFPLQKIKEALNKAHDLESAIDVLVNHNIIYSPEYWLENAVVGETVKGEFAGSLIIKFANYLRE